MTTLSELEQKLNKVVEVGTVTASKLEEGMVFAKVDINGRETDFLPFMSTASALKTEARSIKANEQVVVLNLFAKQGIIIGTLHNKTTDAPKALQGGKFHENLDVVEYEDGTVIKYDVSNSKLTIDANKDIEVNAKNNITVSAVNDITVKCANATVTAENNITASCKNAKITSDKTLIDSPDIQLGTKSKVAGVVTGNCICAFTGAAHPSVSSNTKSSM